MPRNPNNPRVPKFWTPAEDTILLEHMPKIGYRKLSETGLLPGRTSGQIRGRWAELLGKKHRERHTIRDLVPAPQFARQHASVWGYARTVGAAA